MRYVPQDGDRVRVLELHPDDAFYESPFTKVIGLEFTIKHASTLMRSPDFWSFETTNEDPPSAFFAARIELVKEQEA